MSRQWLRATVKTDVPAVGVDRKNNAIRGYVVAEEGDFKTEGRGRFDGDSLAAVVELINAKPGGVKSRLGHPNDSGDAIGTHLGRARHARRDGSVVRADLFFDKTAFNLPGKGDVATYLMDLTENDPSALGTSLVLQREVEERQDADGRPLAPIWRPTEIHASDVVDEGDATNSMLSPTAEFAQLEAIVSRHSRAPAQLATVVLDSLFAGMDREELAVKLSHFAQRYLDNRYGPEWKPDPVVRKKIEDELARLKERV